MRKACVRAAISSPAGCALLDERRKCARSSKLLHARCHVGHKGDPVGGVAAREHPNVMIRARAPRISPRVECFLAGKALCSDLCRKHVPGALGCAARLRQALRLEAGARDYGRNTRQQRPTQLVHARPHWSRRLVRITSTPISVVIACDGSICAASSGRRATRQNGVERKDSKRRPNSRSRSRTIGFGRLDRRIHAHWPVLLNLAKRTHWPGAPQFTCAADCRGVRFVFRGRDRRARRRTSPGQR